jgi:transposase-like protein
MEYPKNQIEFEKMFSTEEDCFNFLSELKYPDGYCCNSCGRDEYWINSRNVIVCKYCRSETSITSGTIFHRSRLPLTTIFRALWWIIAQRNGVSAKGLQAILGIGSYQTAWAWLHKFRRVMVLSDREKLSGIVEVDETFVGGKKSGKRGRGAEGKMLVIIAVEIKDFGTGRIRLSYLPDASRKSINPFLKDNITEGTHVVTDGWKGYVDIRKMGFSHEVSQSTIVADDEEILPNAHRVASLLKRWLLGTHQNYVEKKHLQYYLDEFVFRHNRRKAKNRGLLFFTLMKQAVKNKPTSYYDLVK